MNKNRLENFSDGVVAIIITIMVLELEIPARADAAGLAEVLPILLGYLLSFIYTGIYWVSHHRLVHALVHVDGRVLWANLHLLFWMSLIPFATTWVAGHRQDAAPVALYGAVLLMCSIAFALLVRVIDAGRIEEGDAALAPGWRTATVGSIALYALAVALAFVEPMAANVIYVVLAVLWAARPPRGA